MDLRSYSRMLGFEVSRLILSAENERCVYTCGMSVPFRLALFFVLLKLLSGLQHDGDCHFDQRFHRASCS
jgi:hypothetical protein